VEIPGLALLLHMERCPLEDQGCSTVAHLPSSNNSFIVNSRHPTISRIRIRINSSFVTLRTSNSSNNFITIKWVDLPGISSRDKGKEAGRLDLQGSLVAEERATSLPRIPLIDRISIV
jgi:hypothetical protein